MSETRNGIWFVYDGDCPLCSMAAQALKIRRRYGEMHLVDARTADHVPLLDEIRERGLDLDEGMVIWCEGRFYHGRDALRFMAQFGEDEGAFNRANRLLFKSEAVAAISYPWMRVTRNLLLKLRGVDKLRNLARHDAPLFKAVFADEWEKLPRVLRRRFANRAFDDDVVIVRGNLRVRSSPLGRILKPLFRLLRILVPYEGDAVPVEVAFVTESDSNVFRFDRTFSFPGHPPCAFRSAMTPVGGNRIVEVMGPNLGWCTTCTWDGHKVIFAHRGYALRVFGAFIPLPVTFLLGAGYAEETPVSDDTFSMLAEIRHPWWGRIFSYDGSFTIVKDR